MTTDVDPNHFIPENPEGDDALLGYTNRIRMNLVNEMMTGESKVSVSDNKSMRTLLTTLKDADSQVIAKKRIAAAEKTADGFADIATALDGYMKRVAAETGTKFQRHDGDDVEGDAEVGAPNAASLNIPKREFIEGQLDPSGAEIDIDDIMRKGREAQRGS